MQEVHKIAPRGDVKGLSGKAIASALSARGLRTGPSGVSRAKTSVREARFGGEAAGFSFLADYLRRVQEENDGAACAFATYDSSPHVIGQFAYAFVSLRQCRVQLYHFSHAGMSR